MRDSRFLRGLVRAVAHRVRRLETRTRSALAERSAARRRSVPAGYRAVQVQGRAALARVVPTFASTDVARESLDAVREALDEAGARFVVLPRPVDGRSVVAVDGDDVARLMSALRALAGRPEWMVAFGSGWRGWQRSLAAWAGQQGEPPRRFVVFRAITGPRGRLLGTEQQGVAVETWETVHEAPVPRVDGGLHVPGTRVAPVPNLSYGYLTPDAWEAARRGGAEAPGTVPHLFDVTEPVDVVYTWVDGTDPAWQARMREVLREIDPSAINETATSDSRFATRDELRYSLRSLEMYAGWVRRVHLVTDGQVPEWLDTDHPRIRVVDHRDIFSDPSVLPVFNSHAIESQLHHVPGLADRYLYLNDDVFFGRPVEPELFFEANGLTKFFLSQMLLDVDPPSARDMPVLSAAKNNRALMEKLFGRTVTTKFKHTPHPQNRQVLEELEERFPELFRQVVTSPFRHPDDVSVTSALHHYYSYATRRAVRGDIRYTYRDISTLTSSADLADLVEEPRYDVFCLNDTHLVPGPGADRSVRLLREFLAAYFPVPSTFERAPGA